MNNKDLFNAINDAAEELAPEVWESTESERPVMLRAVKKPRSWIKTALASAAAVLVVGAAVAVGANIYSQRESMITSDPNESGHGDIERNFAPLEDDIVRIRDIGFYSNDSSLVNIGYLPDGDTVGFIPNSGPVDGFSGGGTLEGFPGIDMMEYLKEWYKDPKPREFFYSDMAVGFIPPRPNIYYFNDLPLDSRMLSDEAEEWLYRYCLLSEEDRKIEAVPEYVRYLAGGGFMRYGDVGFLCDKYTEVQRKYIRECMETEPYPVYSSMKLPQPDVYYYKDIPYHLDQAYTDDARNWLKWFCFLDKETQSLLSGYVPEEMTGTITVCNAEKLKEIVTYKGRQIDVRSVSYDTELFIKWYNSLPLTLQLKVLYEPEELYSGVIQSGQIGDYSGMELPVEIVGPDGGRLTYDDVKNAVISKMDEDGFTQWITLDEIEQWEHIAIDGLAYLAEPGSDEFKIYHVGDEIFGLRIASAYVSFNRNDDDPTQQYQYCSVKFEGEISVDAVVQKFDGGSGYGSDYCAVVSGLPVVALEYEQRVQGVFVPKEYGIPNNYSSLGRWDYDGDLFGENDRLYNGQGTVLHDVKLENVTLRWNGTSLPDEQYWFSADLCYEEGYSSAYDWANGELVLPVESFTDVVTINWSPEYNFNEWDLENMKLVRGFLKENIFLTEYGAEAYSVADGEIYAVGRDSDFDSDRGKYVVVKHGEHLYTVYSHLCEDKDIPVNVGDKVTAGQLIGYAGTSGYVTVDSSMLGGGAVGYKFLVVF